MATQELSEVQRAFVNETVRPFLERLVRILAQIDLFVLDYDNQQDQIAETDDDLGDGPDGLPRTNAPRLTGTLLAALRANAVAMRGEVTQDEYNALISLLSRDLNTVISG